MLIVTMISGRNHSFDKCSLFKVVLAWTKCALVALLRIGQIIIIIIAIYMVTQVHSDGHCVRYC